MLLRRRIVIAVRVLIEKCRGNPSFVKFLMSWLYCEASELSLPVAILKYHYEITKNALLSAQFYAIKGNTCANLAVHSQPHLILQKRCRAPIVYRAVLIFQRRKRYAAIRSTTKMSRRARISKVKSASSISSSSKVVSGFLKWQYT